MVCKKQIAVFFLVLQFFLLSFWEGLNLIHYLLHKIPNQFHTHGSEGPLHDHHASGKIHHHHDEEHHSDSDLKDHNDQHIHHHHGPIHEDHLEKSVVTPPSVTHDHPLKDHLPSAPAGNDTAPLKKEKWKSPIFDWDFLADRSSCYWGLLETVHEALNNVSFREGLPVAPFLTTLTPPPEKYL